MYSCGECGKPCIIDNSSIERTCNHTGAIIANMSATAISASRMGESSLYDKIVIALASIFRGIHGRIC